MKDKEKQIEFETKQAIAKEIDKVYPNAKFTNGWIAEVLYKLGYRKLPKDSVVLSKEELKEKYVPKSFYELAKKVNEEKIEELKNQLENKGKETAEKILRTLKARCKTRFTLLGNHTCYGDIEFEIDNLAEECGVELKETEKCQD